MTDFLKNKRIAMIGFGDIQHRLALLLKGSGANLEAYRRDSSQILLEEVTPFGLDVSLPIEDTIDVDYVVMTLSPSERSEAGYRKAYVDGLKNVLAAVDKDRLEKIFWVSSTSVFSQDDNSWVTESSEAKPEKATARILLEAEGLLGAWQTKGCIVRFSGIYRDSRHRMIDKIRDNQLTANVEQDYYTNRIHVQDCARVLEHLLQLHAGGSHIDSLYLGTDDEPVKYTELVHWISRQADLPLNDELPAIKKVVASKRIDNGRLKATGFEFLYPGFRAGFAPMLKR